MDFKELNTRIHHAQRLLADFIKRHRTVKLLHLLRNYSALVVVVSSALLVTATNVASGKSSGSMLLGYWSEEDAQPQKANKISAQANRQSDLASVPLSRATTAVDPQLALQDTQSGQTLAPVQSPFASALASAAKEDPEEDGGVKMYTIEQGDTISTIALKFKISVNTILWANDIENVDSIMPGDTIFILPVSGVQYAVKSGDNIDVIAEKFQAKRDEIIAFNELPANGDLKAGETIIIPDGKGTSQQTKPKPETTTGTGLERRQYATSTGGTPAVSGWRDLDEEGKPGAGHRFPYGYCTWYVAQKRFVPWSGNAGTWLYRAKAMGYKTGKAPRPGSIIVTTENRYYGHVALVEKVNGDTITVSEMNYAGWGKTSRRTLSATSRVIKGFIY